MATISAWHTLHDRKACYPEAVKTGPRQDFHPGEHRLAPAHGIGLAPIKPFIAAWHPRSMCLRALDRRRAAKHLRGQ